MKTWTTQAEKRLSDYLHERARREGFEGEEAEELKDDLRRHVHEEAEKEAVASIGLMQLETILGRLDAGYRPLPLLVQPTAKAAKRMSPSWGWTFGVVLPLGVTVFEWLTSFCGGVFFDPVATVWHALLVLAVPGVNAWLLRGAPRGSERTKGWAAGFATVVGLFYALLFLPLLPWSALALIFLGMGLLSLTPVLAGLWTLRIGLASRRESADPSGFRRGWKWGLAAAVLALAILEGPALWTRSNLGAALAEDGDREAAVKRLRAFHSQRTLLRACYEGNRGTTMATDISGWIGHGWKVPLSSAFSLENDHARMNSEQVRDLFFRVTGRSFNTLKPPRMVRTGGMRRGRAAQLREVEFDNHLGGDQVAVRLRHLDLAESRFDGHVDARSRLGYGEWTMVFRNGAREAREARCQVLLPRGGRVSRLTLWVNDEPREAAFSSVAKVKAAYKEIAVVQRKDPVLVTMAGPDTVMVQCFPVPAGGEMKIRFGVTAPLDGGRWELPRILERNFGTVEHLEHAVWLQGDRHFELRQAGGETRGSVADGKGHSMAASLPPVAAMGQALAVCVEAGEEPPVLWCEDKFAPPYERYLVREETKVRQEPSGRVLVVIDGSAAMEEAKPWVVEALREHAKEIELMLADDWARSVDLKGLERHRFSGGRDNEPALREAVRRAKAGEIGDIVWLHGPQAVRLSQTEALLQMIERGNRRVTIHEVMAANGPNRLAEALQRSGAMRRGPLLLEPRADFAAFLRDLAGGREETRWHWRRSANPPDEGEPVWDHLARHWAMEAVDSPFSEVEEGERPALAARYQLVTRVSGAVVLETMEQFERHGLTPVDASAAPQIPGVPEPSTGMLVMLAATMGAMRRRRAAVEEVAA